MPRKVDHDERRSQIVAALLAFAGREGLHKVSLRNVASEAGVSLRLVQYYFKSKAFLMQAGLSYLEERSHKRWTQRLAKLPQPTSCRAVLEAFFEEALPSKQQSREFHLLWTSYAMLAMTDRDISDDSFVDGPNRLQERLASILGQGKAEGEFHENIDIAREAPILLGLVHGLGTAVLIGQQSYDEAKASLVFHLERLGR